ncbi:lipoxygenase [Klebsormidium nitens]|uniref:Lipoxygenase n=1 Tax=Klebsormidium nitens TaxID=105231 RepID=A0A1Y1HND0_KLENI|nr:lipoxygenase [Klebsormidium nitens]|eukprot:GAQ78116.1 lipoxygenase [Klebsormidium nitens]
MASPLALLLWTAMLALCTARGIAADLSSSTCLIYSPSMNTSIAASPLTYFRTIVTSGPTAYNYSVFGAPPTGQLGEATTAAEALRFRATAATFAALQGAFVSLLGSGNFSIEQWSDFQTLLQSNTGGASPPYSLPFWEDDTFFGFTRKSVAAQYLAQAQTLPFNLTDSDVSSILGNETLESALQSGRLFVEDLSYPSVLPSAFFRPNRTAVGVVALFFLNDQGDLLPIAIQVAGSAGIWTPKDAPFDWLLAKLYANTASFYLEQTDHFVRTHLVPSSMRIAASNRLFTSHPVRLIVDHYTSGDWGPVAAGLQIVFQGNGGDYYWPYNQNGTLAILGMLVRNYNWTTDDLELNIAARGLTSLPKYPYLDDLRKHNAAISNFTDAYVGLYYQNDADVQMDRELQAWAREIASSTPVKGFPSSISSKGELSGILTHFIRLVSVEHHLTNTYAIYNVYTTPFANRFMTAPPPTSRGTVTAQTILKYVPTSPQDLVGLFGTAAPYRVMLAPGDTIMGALQTFQVEPCATAAVEAYLQALAVIESDISAREANATYPFPLAKPSILPYRSFI